MVTAPRCEAGRRRRSAHTAARQPQASASCARQWRGMATVAHPISARSPPRSGLDQTTAAPPPTEWDPTRLAAPSNVMRGPCGAAGGANP
eukprot:5125302-Alexandrium_andersonii.AAC.1